MASLFQGALKGMVIMTIHFAWWCGGCMVETTTKGGGDKHSPFSCAAWSK